METTLNPLALASTEDLTDELRRRYEACIVVGVRPLAGGNELFDLNYRGGLTHCIGLAERAKRRLLEIANSPSEEIADGDEF